MKKRQATNGKRTSHPSTARTKKERRVNNELLSTHEQQGDESLNQPAGDEQHSEGMNIAFDATKPCWVRVQHLAALSIKAMDDLGHHTLSFHEQLSRWLQDTSWAPIVHSQHDYLQHWLNDSVQLACMLWRLDTKKTAGKKTEQEATLPSA